MGDIGRTIRKVELVPMPDDIPVPEIVPDPVREPVREPVKTGAAGDASDGGSGRVRAPEHRTVLSSGAVAPVSSAPAG